MKKLLLLAIFTVFLPVPGFAGIEYLHENPGKWKPWSLTNLTAGHNLQSEFGWNKKEVEALSKKLKAIADVIKQADSAPKGVDRKVSGGIEFSFPYKFREMKQKPYLPVTGYLIINAFGHFIAHGKPVVGHEGPGINVYFNKFPVEEIFSPWEEVSDGEWGIYLEPKRRGEFQGFPVYDVNPPLRPTVVITRNPKPLWVPVSREKALKAMIKNAEAKDADLERRRVQMSRKIEDEWRELAAKKNNPHLLKAIPGEFVRMLKEERDSLSPSELEAPAYFSRKLSCVDEVKTASCLVDADAPGAGMLVTHNPSFFDPMLPKSAIQVIAMRDFAGYNDEVEEGKDKNHPAHIAVQRQVELMHAVDWNKVADMFLGKP